MGKNQRAKWRQSTNKEKKSKDLKESVNLKMVKKNGNKEVLNKWGKHYINFCKKVSYSLVTIKWQNEN